MALSLETLLAALDHRGVPGREWEGRSQEDLDAAWRTTADPRELVRLLARDPDPGALVRGVTTVLRYALSLRGCPRPGPEQALAAATAWSEALASTGEGSAAARAAGEALTKTGPENLAIAEVLQLHPDAPNEVCADGALGEVGFSLSQLPCAVDLGERVDLAVGVVEGSAFSLSLGRPGAATLPGFCEAIRAEAACPRLVGLVKTQTEATASADEAIWILVGALKRDGRIPAWWRAAFADQGTLETLWKGSRDGKALAELSAFAPRREQLLSASAELCLEVQERVGLSDEKARAPLSALRAVLGAEACGDEAARRRALESVVGSVEEATALAGELGAGAEGGETPAQWAASAAALIAGLSSLPRGKRLQEGVEWAYDALDRAIGIADLDDPSAWLAERFRARVDCPGWGELEVDRG